MAAERLQKIIAAAGIASRRKAEEMISSGRVSVNGEIVSQMGTKADPERDHIRVDGKLLRGPERRVYLMLNKPKGYVTTVTDPERRPTVMDLVRGVGARVYPVGRLDFQSEGLLLMTNDGALVERLMHASSKVPKVYWVKVSGTPSEEAIEKLRRGVVLPPELRRGRENPHPVSPTSGETRVGHPGRAGATRPGQPPGATRLGQPRGKAVKTAPAKIRVLKEAANPWYEVTLIEGRNRQKGKKWNIGLTAAIGSSGKGAVQGYREDRNGVLQPVLPEGFVGGLFTSYKTIFTGGTYNWSFQFNVTVPLRNRNVESSLATSRINRQNSVMTRTQHEQQVIVDIKNYVQALNTAKKQLETSAISRQLSESQLEAMNKRFAAGLATQYDVLTTQDQLANAQGNELTSKINYKSAVINLQQAMSTLLEESNIDVGNIGKTKPTTFK